MKICTDKPDMLPSLDAIGLDPADQSHGMGRGIAPSRHRGATPTSSSRNFQIGLGINPAAGFGSKPGQRSGFDMGSRRGGDQGSEYPQADGWAVAGGSVPARLPTKPGDLSQFGKFNKTDKASAPLSFVPGSVFGRKEAGRESTALLRTNSSSNMFSMLSSNTAEPTLLKFDEPPSRKASRDSSHLAASELPHQRKQRQLPPRLKVVEEMATTPVSENASNAKDDEGGAPADTISEGEALTKTSDDLKEFIQTATAISPPQVPLSSAWSRSPPATQAQTPSAQSPAPFGSINLTHSRRPNTLGRRGVHVKDGVSVPTRNIGSIKQGAPN
jgi:hypothetical protein